MNSGKVKVAKISAETLSPQNSAAFFPIHDYIHDLIVLCM